MSKWSPAIGMLARVRWFNLAILTATPATGIYGSYTTPLRLETLLWSITFYVISMLGTFIPSISESRHR